MNSYVIKFLYDIWSRVCERGDWVFLSTRDSGWQDHAFKFDSDLKIKLRYFLKTNPAKEKDIYFCPLPFSKNRRLAKYVKPVNLLWSDVDDGDPYKIVPSVLWESSPDRYHALWFIKEKMNAEDAAELNRSITYHTGADKGGWDLSQVLRIPGTYNHKYNPPPQVKLLEFSGKEYSPKILAKKVNHTVKLEKYEATGKTEEILSKYKLSQRVLDTLFSEPEEGRRSDVIWYLENKFKDAGMSLQEIMTVIKESEWNKYSGRHDEDNRLRTEMSKLVEKDTNKRKLAKKIKEGIKVTSFGEIMGRLNRGAGWSVKGFWMKNTHGIIAGQPKSFKTTLFMDLCVSLATGKPFLNKYPVESTERILYIQNENADWILRDRFEKMLSNKGIKGKVKIGDKIKVTFPDPVPFYMVNQQGFMLTDEVQMEWLEEFILENNITLAVFDPLYLMFNGDLSSAQDLLPTLQRLLEIKNRTKCGIALIHHWNKGGDSKRGGQRMLGSTTLHGWIESAWYLESFPVDVGENAEVGMEREFRGAGLHHKLDLTIKMGDIGEDIYEIELGEHREKSEVKIGILEVLEERNGVSESYLSSQTGKSIKLLTEEVDELVSKNLIYRESGKIFRRNQ